MSRHTRLARFAAIATLVSLVACQQRGDGLLAASKDAVGDDKRFVSALSSAYTYAAVSETLLESSKRCGTEHRVDDSRCTARAAAAGFFEVLAAEVVACDVRGRNRARNAARAALRTVEAADRDRGRKPAPQPPALPRCA